MKTKSPAASNVGFALIEVLIAVLVLSLGLLGMAGLQAVSLRMNHGAYVRSQATSLAHEIADAMRANRSRAPDYNIAAGTDPPNGTIAAQDVADWRDRVASLLPDGDGTISIPSSPPEQVTITVTWDDSRYEDDPPVASGGGGAPNPVVGAVTFTTEL